MPPRPLTPARISLVLDSINPLPTVAVPKVDDELIKQQSSPSNYYVTLSITRAYTTYTTTILLAGPETASQTSNAAPAPTTNQPAPTTPPAPPAISSTDPSSGTIIGAIFGSILGTILIFLLIWCCFFPRTVAKVTASEASSSTTASHSSHHSRRAPAPLPRATVYTRTMNVKRVHVRQLREKEKPKRTRFVARVESEDESLDDD